MKERLSFATFIWPFIIGMLFLIIYLIAGVVKLIKELPVEDRKKLGKSIFSRKIFISIREIIWECIIHRKIWKTNKLLGYMHMSIALGWLMLIVLGHIEVKLYTPSRFNLPYYPIFFRYFVMKTESTLGGAFFFFLMDAFLLITLSGVILAIYKRFNSRAMGMRRTTKLKLPDQIAVYTLWSVFPLRLMAESFTSEIGGGSFLTRSFGRVFENFVANDIHILPTWWAYSLVLGLFFVCMPFSRFMHIPTEAFLILMRNAGIRSRSKLGGYATAEVYSCSRCGVCIDSCQMVSAAQMTPEATVYFLRKVRDKDPEADNAAFNCLMCRRCVDACPVGIDSCNLKLNARKSNGFYTEKQYAYIPPQKKAETDVLYFAGCMTHLTPGIKKSMVKILEKSGTNYRFMDEDGSICCGRPILLAGEEESARVLIEKNKQIILESGAKTFVTSCPICYNVFAKEYNLPIEVLHHSEYIERLMQEGKIQVNKQNIKAVYHEPCELGRASGIYDAPNNVLQNTLSMQATPYEHGKALCCGGSIGNTSITYDQRKKISADAVSKLCESKPDVLVTACPLCKKTFSDVNQVEVKDIAEVVVNSLN